LSLFLFFDRRAACEANAVLGSVKELGRIAGWRARLAGFAGLTRGIEQQALLRHMDRLR